MYDFLRKVPLFTDLPDQDLARLCEMMEEVHLSPGQELFAEGSRGDRAYIIQTGELEVIKASGRRPILLSVRGAGDVIGEMALLEDAPRNASVRARGEVQLYAINAEPFEQLLMTSPTASRVMLNTVLARYRSTTSMLRQSEKMAQLGTLTAGVAHELNNPAAAVKRGAEQLNQALADYGNAAVNFAKLSLNDEQRIPVEEYANKARMIASKPLEYMDPLERSDQEFALESWLEEFSVVEAWQFAPTLVSIGFNLESLKDFSTLFPAEQLLVVLEWLCMTFNIHNLLAEIGQGSSRISEIVKALKSYTYLDMAPIQEVDIHQGLDNTLLILRAKLAKYKVVREYASDLPSVQGYGSELNQVWTNLIDNAADAIENQPRGQITIRTCPNGDVIWVEIEDNGPGIPEDIQPRIFDPFFTTKPPGKGTGLGLEISYNIIVNKHLGDIKVFSQPGRTVFRVILPLNFDSQTVVQPSIAALPDRGASLETKILENSHRIAVVGISARADRPAYSVPAYLQEKGYQIVPVNPNLKEVLGEKAYPDLLSIPEKVDVVQIFRRSEDVPQIVEQAIQVGAKVVWMQEGIVNEQAAERARQAGLEVVMDECMRSAHRRYLKGTPRG